MSAFHWRYRPITSERGDYSRITGPISSSGPIVDVEIRLHPFEVERCRLEGRIVPLPFRTRAIIDTAAARTCVRAATVAGLLEPVAQANVSTPSGPVKSAVYHLMLQLGSQLDRPSDPIAILAHTVPEVLGGEVLIGLDVLRQGKLVLYGPENRYELILPRTAEPTPRTPNS